jgi:uncharacterized iron-regulated membrane protein
MTGVVGACHRRAPEGYTGAEPPRMGPVDDRMTHRPRIPRWPLPVVAAAALVALLAVPRPARADDTVRELARVPDAPPPSLRVAEEDHGPTHADEAHDIARKLRESGAILPLQQVVDLAHDRHAGRLLQVELERSDERYVYEVEFVDDDGVIWTMYFDAASGGVIESGREED